MHQLIDTLILFGLMANVRGDHLFIDSYRRDKITSCPEVHTWVELRLLPKYAKAIWALSMKSFLKVTFSGQGLRRLQHFPGTVKLWESPGKAGGLPN
jgi:hypothetical protein